MLYQAEHMDYARMRSLDGSRKDIIGSLAVPLGRLWTTSGSNDDYRRVGKPRGSELSRSLHWRLIACGKAGCSWVEDET